jgi:hypothetical protein
VAERLNEVQMKQISQLVYLDVLGKTTNGEDIRLAYKYKSKNKKITIGNLIDYYTLDPKESLESKNAFPVSSMGRTGLNTTSNC